MSHESKASGGAAAAGGFGFQANLGAIVGVHILRGTPVQWTSGLTGAAPCTVSFETSGPGDDLSLELTDDCVVEIQAKRGLTADRRFWSALDALCEGIHADRCDYGILIVCPNSSGSVRRAYAAALERIGDGRDDGRSAEHIKLKNRLADKGYNAETVCARIRIRTVSALDDGGDAVAAARAELAHVCANDRQLISAWHALCQDALRAISNKGRRTVRNLSEQLRACQIQLEGRRKDSPVAIADVLLRWTMCRTEHFEVLGIPSRLAMDKAWLPLTAYIRGAFMEAAASVEEALADYRKLGEKSRNDRGAVDAKTIGTFRKLCVVVGGPGSGKSLLLKALAREFAKDRYVSVRVKLRDLARRMQKTGCGVEEGLLQLGLDGSGISPEQLREASLLDVVLLCDGLDECAERQSDIASGLRDISASHPSYRIILTTRPIGYSTSELHDWRHYEIAPLEEKDTAEHMEKLCRCALEGASSERTSDLLPRIRSYLKEGSASKILARSPLLLGFGAALFLNWKDACTSKVELYQRIFRLIKKTPGTREMRLNLPATAVRNTVLNQLGWLTVASPLSAAEELEMQCAATLQRMMGVSRLEGLSMVEASRHYWEEKGLIERLRHPEFDLIAFIHKSCGEYAAALHLSEMEVGDARRTMGSMLSNPDWNEILDFATETPLATMVAEFLVEQFESEDPDSPTLNRVLRVLVRPEIGLSTAQRSSFLKRVFALARSDDRQKAYRVGFCLSEHDLSGLPEAKEQALALLSADAEWSQLIGWAILVCHFPDSVDRNAVEDALLHYVERSRAKGFFVIGKGKPPFGGLPIRGVFDNYVVGAMKLLLPDRGTEYQDRLVAEVLESQEDASLGFVSRIEKLLRKLGSEDAARSAFRPIGWPAPFIFEIPKEFDAGRAALLSEVVPSAFLNGYSGPVPKTGLKCLASFFRSARILDTSARDLYVWLSEDKQLDAVHKLVRAAASVFELPAERISSEAKAAIALVESLGKEGQKTFALRILPRVDVRDVNWDRGKDVDIDSRMLEGLVHHQSEWVQHLAALFLDVRLTGSERRRACVRMLNEGSGDALYWAAGLTTELPEGREVLTQRLSGRPKAGLHHLFDWLSKEGWQVAPSDLVVLENGLINCGAKTAVSAARWCESTVSTSDTWLLNLLKAASSYWAKHEQPVSTDGGVVPDSPREALLRAICGIAPPPLEELVEFARDSRSDVADAAVDEIVGTVTRSTDKIDRLVESILGKLFTPRQCEKLLDNGVPYGKRELSRLCSLCTDPDPAYRLVAVRYVLGHAEMEQEKAILEADSMREDDDANVRDAVYRSLDKNRRVWVNP